MTNKELIELIYKNQLKQAEDFILYITNRYFQGKMPIKEIKLSFVNNHPFVYFNILDRTRKFSIHFMKNGRIQIGVSIPFEYNKYYFDISNDKQLSKRKFSKIIYQRCFLEAEKTLHFDMDCYTFTYSKFDNKIQSTTRYEITKIIVRNILNRKGIKHLFLKSYNTNILDFHIRSDNNKFFYINTNKKEEIFFERKQFNKKIRSIVDSINYSDSKFNNILIPSKLETNVKNKTRNFINNNIKN